MKIKSNRFDRQSIEMYNTFFESIRSKHDNHRCRSQIQNMTKTAAAPATT